MSVHTEEYKGLTIKIFQEESVDSPRQDDNLAVMVAFHSRYNLGDKDHGFTPDSLKAYVDRKDVISLPLYLYDHSGLTMNTTGFSCRWDTSFVGYIVVTKARIKAETARRGKLRKDGVNHELKTIKHLTKKDLDHVYELLRAEVAVFDQYLRGDIYGYQIEDKDGEHVDSLGWIYGDYEKEDGALMEARRHIDAITNNGTTTPEGQELMPFAQAA